MPTMIESHVVQGGSGGKTGDVPAQFRTGPIGTNNHSECVPPNQGADSPLKRGITGRDVFTGCGNRVDVGRMGAIGDLRSCAPGVID